MAHQFIIFIILIVLQLLLLFTLAKSRNQLNDDPLRNSGLNGSQMPQAVYSNKLLPPGSHSQMRLPNRKKLPEGVHPNVKEMPHDEADKRSSPAPMPRRRHELEILRHILNDGYTNYLIPLSSAEDRVFEVRMRMSLIKIQNLWERTNVKTEALELTMRLQFNWCDNSLSWDPEQFGGVNYVIVPGDRLWIPDIQIINALDDTYALIRDRRFDFKVEHDGCVWWFPTGTIFTRCELDLSYFPFDIQRCPLIFESAMYPKDLMNLTVRYDKPAILLKSYSESGQWDLISCTAVTRLNYVTKSTAFSRVEMTIEMRRKTLYYKINVFFACGLLSTLQVLTFLLPVGSTDRISHSVSVLLSVIVFQSVVVNELPRTSNSVPLLCLYVDFLIGVSVFTVTDAIFSVYMISTGAQVALEKWVSFFRRAFSRCRSCRAKSPEASADENECTAFTVHNQRFRSIDRDTVSGTITDAGEDNSSRIAGFDMCLKRPQQNGNLTRATPESVLIVTANGDETRTKLATTTGNNGHSKTKSGARTGDGQFFFRNKKGPICSKSVSSFFCLPNGEVEGSSKNRHYALKNDSKNTGLRTIAGVVDNIVFFIVLISSIAVPYYMFGILPPT